MQGSKFNQKYKVFDEQMYNDIIIISENLNFNELEIFILLQIVTFHPIKLKVLILLHSKLQHVEHK